MTKYGYDPKTRLLFSWTREFKLEGRRNVVPNGSFLASSEPEMRSLQEIAGCMFLSGCDESLTVRGEPGGEMVGALGRFRGKVATIRGNLKTMAATAPKDWTVCLCGPTAADPKKVEEFCRMIPSRRVYVCPLVDELAAFGALVMNLPEERPRRAWLHVPNEESAGDKFVEFDSKLEGDGYGRMADLVRKGMPILNEMMTGPGLFPFYGRVLTDGLRGASAYMVKSQEMADLFPGEPFSMTYAAMCVPVRLPNTEAFHKASGWTANWVDVVASSDMVPGVSTFMKFYKLMSGRGFFGMSDTREVIVLKKTAPIFRYNRAYRVTLDDWRFDAQGLLQGH